MRRAWSTIFLLCMACMICMSGLCLAGNENWVNYYHSKHLGIAVDYYVETSSVMVREFEGRKYLEVRIKSGESPLLLNLDIENQKYIVIEGYNQITGKTINTDISQMSQQSPTFRGIPAYERILSWVEQNRPDVINEIRTHNRTAPPLPSAPQSAPGANTGSTGTPNVPSGSMEAIVGDIEYEVLESGAVKFSPRCMSPHGDWNTYADSYYIFKKPVAFKAYPGAYVIGKPDYYDETIGIYGSLPRLAESAFDYDPKTQLFTFYQWFWSIEGNPPYHYTFNPTDDMTRLTFRMRVIDKNTVYIENGSPYDYVDGTRYPNESYFTNTYRYMPYDQIQLSITKVDHPFFEYDYPAVEFSFTSRVDEVVTYHSTTWYDDNQCVWFGSIPDKFHGEFFYGGWGNGALVEGATQLTPYVDMARDLAVNGNLGEAPSGGLVIGSNPYDGWYDLIMEDGRIVHVEANN